MLLSSIIFSTNIIEFIMFKSIFSEYLILSLHMFATFAENRISWSTV